MATDLQIDIEDRAGVVADVAEALAKAGINVIGGCGVATGGSGVIHVLVEDADTARAALDAAGVTVGGTSEAVVVGPLQDQPGELARVTRAAADAGISLTYMYVATDTRLVLGADDVDALKAAVGT
ncbi:MAG: ACT domain-containing protein [Candidatus Dormiibacterota bacterium]